MQNVFCQTTEWALIHNTLLLKTDRKAWVAIPRGIIHWRSRRCCRQKLFCCIVPHQPRHSAAEHIQPGTLEPNTISLILSAGTNTTSPPTCPPATHLSHNEGGSRSEAAGRWRDRYRSKIRQWVR